MAFKGKSIVNKRTGFGLRFVQTSRDTEGTLLELEATYPGHSKEPPPHFHPHQRETFTVLEGQLNLRLRDSISLHSKGDVIAISPGTVHSMWNGSPAPAMVNWKVEPAMDTENMMEIFAGLANDGKTNASGVPNLLYAAALLRHYKSVLQLSRPPALVQKAFLWPLALLAGWLGYLSACKKYVD